MRTAGPKDRRPEAAKGQEWTPVVETKAEEQVEQVTLLLQKRLQLEPHNEPGLKGKCYACGLEGHYKRH